MNQALFKQLAEKAGFTAGAERYATPDYQTVEPELLERFAQLLVEACYYWAKENGGIANDSDYNELKQHFGME